MAWGVNNTGWWGEGEIKFFMDGDGEFPTICGTGTEDYFCGSYNFENQRHAPVPGVHHPLHRTRAGHPTGRSLQLAAAVRAVPVAHHGSRPVREGSPGDHPGARMALGTARYLPLQDDIASVAFWYQTEPHAPFPKLPGKDYLEVK